MLINMGLIPYTGNKQELLPKLLRLFPKEKYERFVDAFCGGLSVSLNAPVTSVVANDIDGTLISMYTRMKDPDALQEALAVIEHYGLNKEDKEAFFKFRDEYNKDKNPLWLFVLILHSFSNINRTNDSGDFNAPFGYRSATSSTPERFASFQEKKDNISFVSVPFYQLDIKDTDFLYCDPPYLITDAVYNKFWDESTEKFLYAWLDFLDSRGVKWGVSNVTRHAGKENTILIEWAKKYKVHDLDKEYVFGQHVDDFDKKQTQEVYVCNYENKFTLDDL